MGPLESAIVLCLNEKSQIQVLDRSQPMLPIRPGQAARRSQDYKRHGTTSLFAVLDIATGRGIGKCYGRHRAKEFRKFLDVIETSVPGGLDLHLVMEDYTMHKTPLVCNWLAKRPRWHVHLTPISSSWLNRSSASSRSSPNEWLSDSSTTIFRADAYALSSTHRRFNLPDIAAGDVSNQIFIQACAGAVLYRRANSATRVDELSYIHCGGYVVIAE